LLLLLLGRRLRWSESSRTCGGGYGWRGRERGGAVGGRHSHDGGPAARGDHRRRHGLLSGAIDEDTTFPEDDWRGQSDLFQGENLKRNVEVVRRLDELARESGRSVSQLALAWVLANPAVHVAIVGTRNADHIAESLEAADIELSDSELARIDEIADQGVPIGGPTPGSGGR